MRMTLPVSSELEILDEWIENDFKMECSFDRTEEYAGNTCKRVQSPTREQMLAPVIQILLGYFGGPLPDTWLR